MFFNGEIIITFNSFLSERRNSQVFTHFDLKMTLSFAIIGSIAVTTLKFIPHLDKCSYISAIEEILNDNSKFSKLDIPAGKEINHIVNLEKRITSELKLLKDREIIDKSIYKSIKPVGSTPGILYGLGKFFCSRDYIRNM